ncbi:MAG: Na+/H+ antiporter NhaC, partial [Candidatus Aminicenantes bacterium]|nr:Na+/H+ antiporter NhaC [Candidatus Aminicenantes bacterium]
QCALATFLGVIGILIFGILKLKADIQILLILGLALTAVVAKALGFKWTEIQAAMSQGVFRGMIGLFIFMLIGMTIGSWIQAGTVPALIYYGLGLLSPMWFLPAGFILCSLTSMATGTSWGTAGTVGLALMGIGLSMGIPAPIIAGMIISGAFFGNQLSPMADVTNLIAVSTDTGLYDHIKTMMVTVIPSFLIALVMYAFTGFKYSKGNLDTQQIILIQNTISSQFQISLWLLLPMILVLILSVLKVPAIPCMMSGIFSGVLVAFIFQGVSLDGVLTTLHSGFVGQTGVQVVDKLLNRGGIVSMMGTFSLAFIALALGGILDEMHFMEVLVEKITSRIRKTANLTTVTILSAFATNTAMAESYPSIILNGRLYAKAFDEKGLQRRMLSRSLGEGCVCTIGLIPWSTAGAFMAGALGVPTLQYIPYAYLNLVIPIVSILFSYLGLFVFRTKAATSGRP